MFKKIFLGLSVFLFALMPANKVSADSLDPIVVNEITVDEAQDFIELYARKDVNLAEYSLNYSKSSNGYYTVILPEVELAAGAYYVIGNIPSADLPEKINIVKSGERLVWLERVDSGVKVGQTKKYITTIKAGENWQRVCDEDFEKGVQLSPGRENISEKQCNAPSDGGQVDPEPSSPIIPQYCDKVKLSEISTNEQWIEIYNDSAENIQAENLVNCRIAVQRGEERNGVVNYYYQNLADLLIGGRGMPAYSFFTIDISDTKLVLAKSVTNRSILIADLETEYYSKQKKDTSFAKFANDWKNTYISTRGSENIFQKWQTCQEGTHINEATGNCVKDKEPPAECADGYFRNPETGRCKKISNPSKELTECAEGYYRNPLTNRCKKISTISDKALAECPAGQYRNPATNRCKKYPVKEDLAPCAEGWERNPETNRCRKIIQKGEAKYALEPEVKNESDNYYYWAGLAGLLFIGGLTVWQFWPDLVQFYNKISNFIKRKGKK